MEDNMVKQSIRLFFRTLFLIGKILVSPLHLLISMLLCLILGPAAIKSWATNNEENHNYNVEQVTGVFKDFIKWYKF